MPGPGLRSVLALMAGAFALFVASGALAGFVGESKTVDGLTVHLGVVPTKVLRRHPERFPNHDGAKVPAGRHMHHLVLAVYDKLTGDRVNDAEIDLRVSPLGLVGSARALHKMQVSGVTTYCNYFRMLDGDIYEVLATIKRPQQSRVSRAKFTLKSD